MFFRTRDEAYFHASEKSANGRTASVAEIDPMKCGDRFYVDLGLFNSPCAVFFDDHIVYSSNPKRDRVMNYFGRVMETLEELERELNDL